MVWRGGEGRRGWHGNTVLRRLANARRQPGKSLPACSSRTPPQDPIIPPPPVHNYACALAHLSLPSLPTRVLQQDHVCVQVDQPARQRGRDVRKCRFRAGHAPRQHAHACYAGTAWHGAVPSHPVAPDAPCAALESVVASPGPSPSPHLSYWVISHLRSCGRGRRQERVGPRAWTLGWHRRLPPRPPSVAAAAASAVWQALGPAHLVPALQVQAALVLAVINCAHAWHGQEAVCLLVCSVARLQPASKAGTMSWVPAAMPPCGACLELPHACHASGLRTNP